MFVVSLSHFVVRFPYFSPPVVLGEFLPRSPTKNHLRIGSRASRASRRGQRNSGHGWMGCVATKDMGGVGGWVGHGWKKSGDHQLIW